MWGVDVDENVWDNGKERRPPSVGRQNGGRHLSVWLAPPDSLDHHQPKLWEMAVGKAEQMNIVAKEAGQWRWVIVAHLEWSVSVCQSNYHN